MFKLGGDFGHLELAALNLPSTMTICSLLHEVCAHPFSRILLHGFNLPSCPHIVLASAIPFSVTGVYAFDVARFFPFFWSKVDLGCLWFLCRYLN